VQRACKSAPVSPEVEVKLQMLTRSSRWSAGYGHYIRVLHFGAKEVLHTTPHPIDKKS